MKRVTTFVALLAIIAGGASCMSQARKDAAFADVLTEWRSKNPDATMTPEIEAQLNAAAEERAHGEVTRERQAAIDKATSVATKFTNGDLVGGGLGLLGLIGLGVGAYKGGKKKVPSIAEQIAIDRATHPPGGGDPAPLAPAAPEGGAPA